MNRRNFLRATGSVSAIAAISPAFAFAKPSEAAHFDASVIRSIKERIKPINTEEYELRKENARKLMSENKIDAIIMEGGTSLNYFTGASWGRSERLFCMILPQKGEPLFIAPKFEEGRAKEQIGNTKIFTWNENESPYELIKQVLKDNDLLTAVIGIEETTRYFIIENLQKTIPSLKFQSANNVSAGCRSLKSAHEIELMQIANDITAEVYKASVKQLKEGMTEREFAGIISNLFSEFGVQGGALVLFGASSAYPHGLVKETKLKQGDIVLIDGGCSVEGYESDVTRTTVFGKPTDKMNIVWDIVSKAQSEALKTANPGVSAESVDAAARKIIADYGYGPGYSYFTHRLGHGIGMDGHEWYYLVGGNKYELRPGNMFSNEPGIYIIGEFGIRIEDEMLITDSGAKLLLPKQKSLQELF
ncbi:MAG: M24 family metallopeptidase [Bacteroidia bacterium]